MTERDESLTTNDLAGATVDRGETFDRPAPEQRAANEGTTPPMGAERRAPEGAATPPSARAQDAGAAVPSVRRTPRTDGDTEATRAPGQETGSLFPQEQADSFRNRWGELQARFVDDPREAVHASDVLVAEVMQTLAASFASHKSDLEDQWTAGDVHTEDLRQAFQRYRAFFERLLSA